MQLILSGLRRIRDERRSVFVLSTLATITAQIEALALVIVGLTIESFTSGSREVDASVGPFSINLGIYGAMGAAVVLLVAGAALTLLYLQLQIRAAARIDRRYRDRLATAFAAADWEVQSGMRSGRLSGLLHRMVAVPRLFSGVTSSIRALAMVLVFLVAAFIVSWQVALVTSLLGVALGTILVPLRRRLRSAAHQHSALELRYAEELSEAADLAPDLRVFSGWPAMRHRLDQVSGGIERARRRVETISTAIPTTFQYGGPIIVVALILLLPIVSPAVSLGALASVAFLLLRVIQFGQILQVNQQIVVQSLAVIDQLDEELAVLELAQTSRGRRPLPSVDEVRLEDVSYRYPLAPDAALKGIGLVLSRGQVVGVVGPSGGGKSTLAQILLGLRYPTSGRVLVDGVDVLEHGEEAWRARVAYVPQHPRLLHGTVAENVAVLDTRLGAAQVQDAVRQVGLDAFVQALPEGYDTPVGPTTRALSGGQLQRLAIARALVRHPDVIVLDEPTSALDVDSERVVQSALAELKRRSDALIVVIAHRVSTLAMCDRILVLEQGQVVADDLPDRVLSESGFFGRAQQAAGLLE